MFGYDAGMAKAKTYYLCRNCGAMQAKWLGKCPDCGAWDALDEMTKAADDPHRPRVFGGAGREEAAGGGRHAARPEVDAEPTAVADIPPLEVPRVATGLGEFDRVLGGGLVPGSAILLGGEPGIGKSTLLLQALAAMASAGHEVLYVTSEESAQQTQLRAQRLGAGASRLKVYAETNLEKITERIGRLRPLLCVIDSVQMIYQPTNESAPGSASQLRDCCTELVYLAKASGTGVCLVGHVTKEGMLAGPKLIEHIVDTVLYFEGDPHHDHRIVRCAKNRFGTTLELGLFRMTGAGLEGISESANLLIEHHGTNGGVSKPAGSIITAALQGSRVLLVEVQALTADAGLGNAKRKVTGCDASRVAMIMAVLEKRAGLRLVDRDVFVNVVGGLKLSDPSADAAIALAIASAHMGRGMPSDTVVLGELGLLGELRPVAQMGQRLVEAERLGFARAVAPVWRGGQKPKLRSMVVEGCRVIDEGIGMLG
jgi:DNA repair protein RadA/Sms